MKFVDDDDDDDDPPENVPMTLIFEPMTLLTERGLGLSIGNICVSFGLNPFGCSGAILSSHDFYTHHA